MSKLTRNPIFIRTMLAIGMIALITAILPHADHQAYSYEENQPWKYQLLTARFDVPIKRDSATAQMLRDSIDRTFIPFVKRDNQVSSNAIERFRTIISGRVDKQQFAVLLSELQSVYSDGIVDNALSDVISGQGHGQLRITDANSASATTISGRKMRTPRQAYQDIDSVWRKKFGHINGQEKIPQDVSKALSIYLMANIVIDSVADAKFRNQEYLNATGARGVIKAGQRIVDRGEIVTPQIYINLNTYMDMLDRQNAGNEQNTNFLFGQVLYLALWVGLLYIYMHTYRSRFFANMRQMAFLMIFITLFVVFAVVMFENVANGIYLVPFAAVPVVIMIFFDSRTAIFALITTIMISAIVATFPLQFIFLELAAGLTATYSMRQLTRRSQLLNTAIYSFIAYCICYFASILLINGTLDAFSPRIIGYFAINSVILSFAYILIYVIEKIFGFTSMVTLVELSDINSPLLRRLAEEAPGTFQHSMQVSMLAAEAARTIGANTALVRTGALYHDIGKLESPIFFTENQHGVNPHAGLDPETSARKIVSHVTGGVKLAEKSKLPERVRQFISEHHGRGLTKYFYNTAVNNADGKAVDKEPFTYPGPDPQSKETAILMMADAVEAASRSLHDYSPESISALVDRIVDGQVAEGRFNEAPISLRDIQKVKDTFKKRLATIYHSRVAYPELKKKETNAEAEEQNKIGS